LTALRRRQAPLLESKAKRKMARRGLAILLRSSAGRISPGICRTGAAGSSYFPCTRKDWEREAVFSRLRPFRLRAPYRVLRL